MSRLFTFGCSFSSYQYPTYADYMGSLFDIHYNMASAGAGNHYILSSFLNALREYNINKDDYIIYQTTGIPRHDSIDKSNQWNNEGNIGYDQDKIKEYGFSFINSAFYLITALNLLWYMKNNGYNLTIIPMISYQHMQNLGEIGYDYEFTNNEESKKLHSKMIELYKIERHIMIDTDMFTFQYDCNEKSHYWYNVNTDHEIQNDDHPSTKTHLKFAKYLCKKYIKNDNSYRLDTDKITNLCNKWENFFQIKELKNSQEYRKNIFHKKRLKTDLGVGWPNHLFKTEYKFIGYK